MNNRLNKKNWILYYGEYKFCLIITRFGEVRNSYFEINGFTIESTGAILNF